MNLVKTQITRGRKPRSVFHDQEKRIKMGVEKKVPLPKTLEKPPTLIQ